MNRRQLLLASGAFAVMFAIGRYPARAAAYPFPLGVGLRFTGAGRVSAVDAPRGGAACTG